MGVRVHLLVEVAETCASTHYLLLLLSLDRRIAAIGVHDLILVVIFDENVRAWFGTYRLILLLHIWHDGAAEKAAGFGVAYRLLLLHCGLLRQLVRHCRGQVYFGVVPLREVVLELGALRLLMVRHHILLSHVRRVLVNVNQLVEVRAALLLHLIVKLMLLGVCSVALRQVCGTISQAVFSLGELRIVGVRHSQFLEPSL